jgi:hypothetical protein
MMAVGFLQAKAREKMTHDESNNEQEAWRRRLGREVFATEDKVCSSGELTGRRRSSLASALAGRRR